MLNRWRNLNRTVGLPLLRLWVEQVSLSPLMVGLTRRLFARRIALIETLFDRDFYLRQLKPDWSRRAASREPALHYHFVGRFHRCWPHPDFDPTAYHNDHPHLTWLDDPLIDHARADGTRIRNRTERRIHPCPETTVVVLHHARGGGSDHYLDLMERRLRREGTRVVRLARLSLTVPLFRARDREAGEDLSEVIDLRAEPDRLGTLLDAIGASRLIVNHAVDLDPELLASIAESCRRSRVPFEVHLHDYLFLCPRINLVDAKGHVCSEDLDQPCAGCTLNRANGPPLSRAAWREAAHAFLTGAAAIVAPSRDVAERHGRYWPDLAITVRPPEDDSLLVRPRTPPRSAGRPLTIAVLGRLNVPKGFHVVLSLAVEIRRSGRPVDLVLIGQSIDDASLRRRGVIVHGRYRAGEAPALLERYAPDLVLLPSIWPETWSFVLTVVLDARLPVATFDIGAPAERLRRLGFGTLLPLELAGDPARLLQALVAVGALAADPTPRAGDPVPCL